MVAMFNLLEDLLVNIEGVVNDTFDQFPAPIKNDTSASEVKNVFFDLFMRSIKTASSLFAFLKLFAKALRRFALAFSLMRNALSRKNLMAYIGCLTGKTRILFLIICKNEARYYGV